MKKIDLKSFGQKIVVRPIKIADYDQLVDLQKQCFPGTEPWTKDQIQSQLDLFPEGQICLEIDGLLVASSSSLIVDFNLYGDKHSWRDIADAGFIGNHYAEGDTPQGMTRALALSCWNP